MFSLVTSYIREKSWFYFVLLVFIVLIGAGLRLIALDEVPGVLHRDETSIGFNAYSIANTGKDEHGVAFPISFQAFGDYKLPGLIYLTSISVSIFGLTETAVRLPTALAAVATLPAVFWLVREMGWSRRVALVSVVLLTLSFWHISQARNVYEPMVGLLLSVMTFSSWLAGKRRKIFWLLTPLLYGAAALTYNVPFLILPVLLTGSALMFYKIENKNLSRNTIFGGASVLASVWILLGVVAALSWGVNASRSNTTVFFHSEIMEWSELATHGFLVNGVPSPLARIVSFPGIDSMIRVMSGYVSAFDPNYLFFVGDQNPWHNLQSISLGNMNPILLFFVVFGVYALWQQRSHIAAQLLALYLFIAPIPNAVTIDAPITNRLLDFHLAVTIIAALGVISLWEKVYESSHNTLVKSIPALLTVAYIAMFAVFLLRYFFVFNPLMSSFWNPEVDSMVSYAESVKQEYSTVIIDDLDLAYTYFAFYAPFSPEKLQSDAEWIQSGFVQVATFEKYSFLGQPDWDDLTASELEHWFDADESTVLVVRKGEPSAETKRDHAIVWEKKDHRGQWFWHAFEVDKTDLKPKLQPQSY